MAKRVKVVAAEVEKPNRSLFFTEPQKEEVFSTGCTLLDAIMGGGLVKGRIYNIVGDFSTSKTGVATEAMICYRKAFPEGHKPFYNETENAYDHGFAQALGLKREDYEASTKKTRTVGELYTHLEKYCKSVNPKKGGFYIVDSLDALSDAKELEAEFDKNTYGATKAKDISKLFRVGTNLIAEHNVCLLIVSQIRDKIGVAFGDKFSRSGGKALDFYASCVVYLAKLGAMKQTKKGIERKIGFRIRANNKKSKVGLPGRVIDYPVVYGFGIDDLRANVEFLYETKRLGMLGVALDDKMKAGEAFLAETAKLPFKEYRAKVKAVASVTRQVWQEIENEFMPKHRKYA